MTLEALARRSPQAGAAPVPDWTLGCFHRRSITYADGREDASTRVIWIQSHGLTGDIRVPAWRPAVADLDAAAPADLGDLAAVEGGVADTRWDGRLMHWENWDAFQPYDKWPEPGLLRRVGTALVEWAPSGVYVEDWRLQQGCAGLLAGLRLVSETGADGVERPRGGGLIVAGSHALFSLARRTPLDAGASAQAQLAARPELRAAVFDAETSYAVAGPDGYRIALSTNALREGTAAPIGGDFRPAGPGMARQVLGGVGGVQSRLWRIDTLLPDWRASGATPVDSVGRAWLQRESPTLLRGL